MGADYVEPDVVMTRDGILISRHENEMGHTTDVGERPEFAAKRRTRNMCGKNIRMRYNTIKVNDKIIYYISYLISRYCVTVLINDDLKILHTLGEGRLNIIYC